MADGNKNKIVTSNKNMIIVAVSFVVLVVIFMFFRDRQQKRDFQLERLDAQKDVVEEWGPPGQNTPTTSGGKIL